MRLIPILSFIQINKSVVEVHQRLEGIEFRDLNRGYRRGSLCDNPHLVKAIDVTQAVSAANPCKFAAPRRSTEDKLNYFTAEDVSLASYSK